MHDVPLAVEDERLEVVGRVIRARDDDPPHAFLERDLVDVVGHRDVGELGLEAPLGVVRVAARDEAEVDDGVDAAKVAPVGVSVAIHEVGDLHSFDRVPVAVRRPDVEQRQVVALTQRRQHLARDEPGRARDQNVSSRHSYEHGAYPPATRGESLSRGRRGPLQRAALALRRAQRHDQPRRAIFPYFGHYWIKRMDEFYRRPLPEYIVAHDDPLVRQLFGRGIAVASVHGGYDALSYA